MRKIYVQLVDDQCITNWSHLIIHNDVRPRVVLFCWLACHGHLATKARALKDIWKEVLQWLGIVPHLHSWKDELGWILSQTRGKGRHAGIIKMVAAETIYEVLR
ncbi:unnamed protein product [Lathyrus sativus]|nr:unnamed protein product [Lathyrus sativus]